MLEWQQKVKASDESLSIEDSEYPIQVVGGEGEGAVEGDITSEGATLEYLTVLLLSPTDGCGVQYREGLVLMMLEQWHNLKGREWKLIRLG